MTSTFTYLTHPKAIDYLACIVFAGLLAVSSTALGALHTVSYSNGVDPPIVVADGAVGVDMDTDADEIEVHFTLQDGIANDWVASGIIRATTTDPNGATLVVTETTIQNVSGEQVNAQIFVNHDFPPVVTLATDYIAHIDGSFDKIGGGLLGNLTLIYGASITGAGLGGQNFMAGLVAAPVLFSWTGLPVHQDTIIHQAQDFIFYMDELDNTINLFNSATILPVGTVDAEATSWDAIKKLYR